MTKEPRRWALILGASSGFGAAAAKAFVEEGYDIIGIHLDRRNRRAEVDLLIEGLKQSGQLIHFFNINAADDKRRAENIERIHALLSEHGGKIKIFLHSLAFGSLLPLVSAEASTARKRHLDMTIDVMANSLVYWTQDLLKLNLFDQSRIFAMTSAGGRSVWSQYGPVSAAKAALESHVRQLAVELASWKITVNAIQAGVTNTAALRKIPNSDSLIQAATSTNPHRRLTQPEDVARCLISLASEHTYWMTGNIICVDGGENLCA